MYKYEFKDRNRVIFTCEAQTLSEATEKFNLKYEIKYCVIYDFFMMGVVSRPGYPAYGVTWTSVN